MSQLGYKSNSDLLLIEFSKPGYAKRFVILDIGDLASRQLCTQLAETLSASLRFCSMSGIVSGYNFTDCTFELPDDSAIMVLDLTAYYGAPAEQWTAEQHTKISRDKS